MSVLRKLHKARQALGNRITRRALAQGVGASFEHRALLSGLGQLSTIVDVGANVGQFALISRITQPGAIVHSFEPIKSVADKFHSVLGHDDHVKLHTTALGSNAGEAEINISARADSSSLLKNAKQADVFPGTHTIRTEKIHVSRLSDVLSRDEIVEPALLKIDVQGFEGEVLKGCEDMLDRFEWIYCEMSFMDLYEGQPLARDLLPWLADRRFSIASVETDELMVRNGRAVQADFLFHNDGND